MNQSTVRCFFYVKNARKINKIIITNKNKALYIYIYSVISSVEDLKKDKNKK